MRARIMANKDVYLREPASSMAQPAQNYNAQHSSYGRPASGQFQPLASSHTLSVTPGVVANPPMPNPLPSSTVPPSFSNQPLRPAIKAQYLAPLQLSPLPPQRAAQTAEQSPKSKPAAAPKSYKVGFLLQR